MELAALSSAQPQIFYSFAEKDLSLGFLQHPGCVLDELSQLLALVGSAHIKHSKPLSLGFKYKAAPSLALRSSLQNNWPATCNASLSCRCGEDSRVVFYDLRCDKPNQSLLECKKQVDHSVSC